MIMQDNNNIFIVLKKKLDDLVGKAIDKGVFPGAVIGISFGPPAMRRNFIFSYGYASKYPEIRLMISEVFFDLASLTKPLATTLAILYLIKEKSLSLYDTLPYLLEKSIPLKKKI